MRNEADDSCGKTQKTGKPEGLPERRYMHSFIPLDFDEDAAFF